MAPEQIRDHGVDARSDLYALGVVLYEAIAGLPPFTEGSAIAIGFAHCTETPQPLRTKCPHVSDGWNDLVLRALAKVPAQRFAPAAELRAALPGA